MSSSSADDSPKSATPNSTSTYEYRDESNNHEPFETFQTKVLTLAHDIFPDAREVELEQRRGGGYNRVVIVRMALPSSSSSSSSSSSGSLAGIFRIPRHPELPEGEFECSEGHAEPAAVDPNVQDQAAVLLLLESRHIPAPHLIAFDASTDNAIQSPFVLLEFAAGAELHLIYGTLCTKEQLEIAEAMVDFLFRMEEVRFSECGMVVAKSGELLKTVTKASKVSELLEIPTAVVRGFHRSRWLGHNPTADNTLYTSTSTQELLHQLLLDYRETEKSVGVVGFAMWDALCEMFEDMCDQGCFSDLAAWSHQGSSILYHWDLDPRNIIVTRSDGRDNTSTTKERVDEPDGHSKSKWIIDKVIDWDRVQAVPPILARKPLVWLWDVLHDSYRSNPDNYDRFTYDGDADLLPASRHDPAQGDFSPEQEAVRAHFEKCFVREMQKLYPRYNAEVYQDEAYGRGSWIRRIARFAIHGAGDGEDTKRFHALERDWSRGRLQFVRSEVSSG
jgi:hypothetical protein